MLNSVLNIFFLSRNLKLSNRQYRLFIGATLRIWSETYFIRGKYKWSRPISRPFWQIYISQLSMRWTRFPYTFVNECFHSTFNRSRRVCDIWVVTIKIYLPADWQAMSVWQNDLGSKEKLVMFKIPWISIPQLQYKKIKQVTLNQP